MNGSYPRSVSVRNLILAAILVAAAVTIARALISGDELGALEYVAGVALVLALAALALRATRRTCQRGSKRHV